MMMSRPNAIAACLLLAVLAAHAEDDEAGPKVEVADMKAQVRVATAHAGELPVRIHGIGTVVPRAEETSALVALVAGVVAKVEARDGQEVAAGAPIVRLDDRPMKEAMTKAGAALKTAELELSRVRDLDAQQAEYDFALHTAALAATQARKEADRQKGLLADQLTSEKAATEAAQFADAADQAAKLASDKAKFYREKGRAGDLARLQAAVDAAKADEQAAQRAVDAAVLSAPHAGRVSGLSALPGQSLDAGTLVARVISPAGLAVRVFLSPSDADAVKVDAPADLPDLESVGKVLSVGAGVDPDTGLVPVIVSIEKHPDGAADCPCQPRLGGSVFADVDTSEPAKGIVVPVAAVTYDGDQANVYVVDGADAAHAVPVSVLARSATLAVVSGEGLAEGARVIVDGNYNLPDGAHVVVLPAKKDGE